MSNYPTAKDVNRKIVITVNSNKTLARIFDDKEVISSGVATCSPEDTFDLKTGAELAMARAFEKLLKPVEVEWKVVKRYPKSGDYIRLKSTRFTFNRVGDILKVHYAIGGHVKVKNCDHPRKTLIFEPIDPNYLWNYFDYEYEVVEKVEEPKFRKITRDPRPGDYIRIISSVYDFDEPGDVLKIHDIASPDCVSVLISDHPKLKQHLKETTDGYWSEDYWVYCDLFDKFEFVEKVN